MKKINLLFTFYLIFNILLAQPDSLKLKVSGNIGVSYDGYMLSTNPETPSFYTQRKPSHLLRFMFQPVFSYGDFKLPFNINFSPMRNNFGSPPFGFGNLPGFPKQTFTQWLTNPMNNIGVNPSYKWAELQLGTQYLKYSDLSTGDIGTFGYGISIKPGKLRLKFFRGVSQQAYKPFVSLAPPATYTGAYKRTITMGQIGFEKEGKYFAGFNLVKSKDDAGSITTPLTGTPATPKPADNFIVSFVTKFITEKGWYGQTEFGTTITSRDATSTVPNPLLKDFKPFITTNSSSFRDHAAQAGFGKKGKDWDVGVSTKWLGAGYYSMGYPFTQNDRLEYTVNTRFNAWKKKMNVVASIGQRFGNRSNTANRTTQIIANANVFTQFNEHFSLNANYNNFGFQTPGVSGIKNVGNDLGINPTYSWNTDKMSNLISLSYNWSKYDETDYQSLSLTSNNSQSALLMYVPSFFNKPNLSPDISILYFQNTSTPGTNKLKMYTLSTSLGYNFPKQKINTRGQLQYNITTIDPFTASKNILATLGADWSMTKKLTWNASLTANIFKYGNELIPPPELLGARYIENTFKTALLYKFGK
ncbi:MAG: hypothetical protein WC780_04395 [Lentimicrobiaceae bacterium]|jgi:hypothetical protein